MNENIKDILEDLKDDEIAVANEWETIAKSLSFLGKKLLDVREGHKKLINELIKNNE